MKQEWFNCDCGEAAHAIQVTYDNSDPDWHELYISMRLRIWRRWWQRIPIALRYLFGRDACPFGEYDSITFGVDEAKRLKSVVDAFLEAQQAERVEVERT